MIPNIPKFIASVLIILTLGLTVNVGASSAQTQTVTTIKNAAIDTGGDRFSVELKHPVYIVDGRVLLPIRELGETAGLRTYWNAQKQTVSLYAPEREIQLTINSKTAYINGKKTTIDVPAQIINGNTYLPIRFVATALNQTVSWDNKSHMVKLPSKYAIGMDQNMTYWINRDNKNIYEAIGQQKGSLIGKAQIDLYYSLTFDVEKLTDSSAYLKAAEAVGVMNRLSTTERILVADHKVAKESLLVVYGDYPETSIDRAQKQLLFTNGDQTDLVTLSGQESASYSLSKIMNKKGTYLVEHADPKFLIVREYETQHLILYNIQTQKPVYLHEVLKLPEEEKNYLTNAGMDRYSGGEQTHIIKFVKNDNGVLTFKYVFVTDNTVHRYTYSLN